MLRIGVGNEKEEARAEHEPPPPRAGSSPRHRPDVKPGTLCESAASAAFRNFPEVAERTAVPLWRIRQFIFDCHQGFNG